MALRKQAGVPVEELTDFKTGDPVMTVDGFPGRVTAVNYGPYPGTETYQVELDAGLGGGDYTTAQLRPYRTSTASVVEATEVYSSMPVEATTDHTANVDYPELEDILTKRLPNENIKIYAARKISSDDEGTRESWEPGETAHYEYHCLESPESSDAHLWRRSHQPVTVLHRNEGEPGAEKMTKTERGEEGIPFTYRVRFPDGHEGDAWEDELMTHPRHWYRPDPPRTAARNVNQMGTSEAEDEDSTENLDQDQKQLGDDPEDVDGDNDAGEDNALDGSSEDEEEGTQAGEGKFQVGDVKPPDACSFCGNASFSDPQMTGRGVRMTCDQCKGTMTSWGGQWQPDAPNNPHNNASETWDYRSGGPGGKGQAPTGPAGVPDKEPTDNLNGEDDDEDGKTIKLKVETVLQNMTRHQAAQSLQAESGIVQYLFNKLYEKARAKYERDQVEWWQPPAPLTGTNLEGQAQYPKQVSLGSKSELNDPVWRWHFTATWMDVQAKARRIRREGYVKIVAASNTFVSGEVKGDNGVYETQLNYVPGTRKVADWACGCKWAAYTWGRSPQYKRFEGRLCSHALATQYEANSRGIFNREIQPDTKRPDWQHAHHPVVVQYDKAKDKNLTRRAVPPGNMRRTFSSYTLDSDGIYPEPRLVDLQHAPLFVQVTSALDNGSPLSSVIEMVASFNLPIEEARAMVFEALVSDTIHGGYLGYPEGPESGSTFESEASKQHRKHHHTEQDHGRTWGYGFGWGWGPCGYCGGSGCQNCNGTGQVPASDPAAVGDGGAVDAGTTTASVKTASSPEDAFDYGHERGYDYADRLQAHNNGMADQHPGAHEDERDYAAQSWIDRRHQQHVLDGWDHGFSTYQNEESAGLPHRGGSLKTASEECTCSGARKIEPHSYDEHPEWAEKMHAAGKTDAWGRPLHRPYDGHGPWDCNNYHCAEHPQEMYEHRPGRMPGWMEHDTDPHRELTREINKSFYDNGQQEDARFLLDQNHTGPSRYSSLHTADYSTNDPLVGLDGGHSTRPTVEHSNSENPASSGWATGQDPADWGKSLISNDFGVTFESALHNWDPLDFVHPEAVHACQHCGRPLLDEEKEDGFCHECGVAQHSSDVAGGHAWHMMHRGPVTLSGDDWADYAHNMEYHPEHFTTMSAKNTDAPTVSGVALKAADTGRVLMIQRSIHDKNDPARGTWEMPGGHHEPGDKTSLHAAIREFEEEVGQPFPHGGHLTHVHRSGPYLLHTVVVPDESSIDFSNGRSTVNPDDPDGDDHEQSAWWDPDHAAKNPALRPELKKSNPFGDIKKAAALPPPPPDPFHPEGQPGHVVIDPNPAHHHHPLEHVVEEVVPVVIGEEAYHHLHPMVEATLNDEPEGALPFTDGAEDIDADPGAGNTADQLRDDHMEALSLAQTREEILEAFHRTAGGKKIAKEAMKDFSYAEQQALIQEGEGDRARNFGDLRLEGTHYALIPDDMGDDETILWV